MNLHEIQSFYDFTDRTVLVTGGAGVLGFEIARTLVECNANVVILSRNQERAAQCIADISMANKKNGRVIYVHGDVLDVDTLKQADQTVRSQFGEVDILINAAGGNHPSATASADL